MLPCSALAKPRDSDLRIVFLLTRNLDGICRKSRFPPERQRPPKPAKNIFYFRVRFPRVFALLGASVIGADSKIGGHAMLPQAE
jgi:hypothetical protein